MKTLSIFILQKTGAFNSGWLETFLEKEYKLSPNKLIEAKNYYYADEEDKDTHKKYFKIVYNDNEIALLLLFKTPRLNAWEWEKIVVTVASKSPEKCDVIRVHYHSQDPVILTSSNRIGKLYNFRMLNHSFLSSNNTVQEKKLQITKPVTEKQPQESTNNLTKVQNKSNKNHTFKKSAKNKQWNYDSRDTSVSPSQRISRSSKQKKKQVNRKQSLIDNVSVEYNFEVNNREDSISDKSEIINLVEKPKRYVNNICSECGGIIPIECKNGAIKCTENKYKPSQETEQEWKRAPLSKYKDK